MNSSSSYYKWLQSLLSQKQIDKQSEDERITVRIKEISNSNNSLFGIMTMYCVLRNEEYGCGHNRAYRLMCINDIKSSYRRRSKYKYTKSKMVCGCHRNQSSCKWGKTIHIAMINLYDRVPVALEVSDKNDIILADQTLDDAHGAYPEATPLIYG